MWIWWRYFNNSLVVSEHFGFGKTSPKQTVTVKLISLKVSIIIKNGIIIISFQIYFYTCTYCPHYWGLHINGLWFFKKSLQYICNLKVFTASIWVMTGTTNTCNDCVTSSLLWPGKRETGTLFQKTTINLALALWSLGCNSVSGPGDTEVTPPPGQVSLPLPAPARPDSPTDVNISGAGTERGPSRVRKWAACKVRNAGPGWSGNTRKGWGGSQEHFITPALIPHPAAS